MSDEETKRKREDEGAEQNKWLEAENRRIEAQNAALRAGGAAPGD